MPPHRYRYRAVALHKIRNWQKSTALRIVCEIAEDCELGVRFLAGAATALQNAAEDMPNELFEEAQRAAIHAKRMVFMPKDIQLATRMVRGAPQFRDVLVKNKRGAN